MKMERAIKVIDCILGDETLCDGCIDEYTVCCAECKREAADMAIKALQEKKTGKWLNINDGKWNTCEVLKCSVCEEMDNRMYRTDNYCPHCGAKMIYDGE